MAKIIPFAMAVIIVLAAGFYIITTKYPKSSTVRETQSQGLQGKQNDGSDPIATVTPISKQSNQIALTITSPKDGSTVMSQTITLSGNTAPYAQVAVNDKDVSAGANGNFATTLVLEEGDNYIYVVANDEEGFVAEQELMVIYEPAAQ